MPPPVITDCDRAVVSVFVDFHVPDYRYAEKNRQKKTKYAQLGLTTLVVRGGRSKNDDNMKQGQGRMCMHAL